MWFQVKSILTKLYIWARTYRSKYYVNMGDTITFNVHPVSGDMVVTFLEKGKITGGIVMETDGVDLIKYGLDCISLHHLVLLSYELMQKVENDQEMAETTKV